MFISPLFIRIAVRNVRVYWRQSLAAIISVIAGFVAFAIFEGYLKDIYFAYTDFNERLEMYGDFIIERKGASEVEGRADQWAFTLTQKDQEIVQELLNKNQSDVEAGARFLSITGSIDTATSSTIFQGIGYDVIPASTIRGRWKWDTYWGKPLSESTTPDQQMIVGLRLAQKLGCLPDHISGLEKYMLDLEKHPQNRPFLCPGEEFQASAMTENGQINAIDLSISGIQDKGFLDLDSRYAVFSLPAAQRLFNTDKVSYYTLKLKPNVDQNDFIQRFENDLKSLAPHIRIVSWKQHFFGVMYKKTLSLLDVIRNFLISIIIFVGAMSVFNTLVKLVKERTQEIGMLRSLGFRPQQIRQLFLLESIFLSWVGCIIGSILSFGLSIFFNKMDFTYPSGQFSFESPFHVKIGIATYVIGFLLMTVIAILACQIAVRKPSKENISNLLLHT